MRVLKVDERAGEVTVLMTLEEAHSLSVNVGGHPLYPERAERLEARLRSFHTDSIQPNPEAYVPPTPTLAGLARAKEEARRWDEELRRDRDADMAADEDSCGTLVMQYSMDRLTWVDTYGTDPMLRYVPYFRYVTR
jgi:hypothetical protein